MNQKSFISFFICAICFGALLFVAACKNGGEKPASTNDIDIHTAVVSGDIAKVKAYIANGGDLNVRDPFGGSSPLISASVFGKTEAAKLLIDAGADINFQNNEGSTALHTAAFFCRPDIVKMLLEKQADKTIKNKYEATALDNVAGPFDQMKGIYDMMVQTLGPMGLTLDYAYLETTRPEIAIMLGN